MTCDLDQLFAKSVLSDYRFVSQTPVIGGLFSRLRSVWYNVAARWGDQSIIDQQTAHNQAVAQYVGALEQRNGELEQQINELSQQLILVDHDVSQLTYTVAELAQQVIQLRQVVAELDIRRVKADD